MNRNSIGVGVVLIVIIAGGWYLLSRSSANTAPATTDTAPTAATAPVVAGVTVAYGDQGFSPRSVTIPLGTTVTFVNQSSGNMWVASAMHPTHAVYSGTTASEHCPDATNAAFDACTAAAEGGSFSFTFNKEGTWKYHDHANASQTGTVVVTAALPL